MPCSNRVVFSEVPVAALFGADRSKRRWVALDEIPEHVRHAVLATEDRRFYSHTGLDPIGIGTRTRARPHEAASSSKVPAR